MAPPRLSTPAQDVEAVSALLGGGFPDYAETILAAAARAEPRLLPALALLRAGDGPETLRRLDSLLPDLAAVCARDGAPCDPRCTLAPDGTGRCGRDAP